MLNSRSSKNIEVLLNDYDIDNAIDPTSVLIVTNTNHGTTLLNTTTGVITYTPVIGYVGNDTLTYSMKDVLGLSSNIATVVITIPTNNIVAMNDDFSASPINGAKGGVVGNILVNDSLNHTLITDHNQVVISIVNNGGLTGASIDTTGILSIPAGTFEGTYSMTYSICEKANATNCSTATITVVVGRGLQVTTTSICRNDVPYLAYTITPNFIPASANEVSITWLNGDGTSLNPPVVYTGLTQSGELLWPGAVLDNLGNPIDWPGWYTQNGQWIQGPDGFEGTRPNSIIKVTINPTDSVVASYPPATPMCNAAPHNFAPVAQDDVNTIAEDTQAIGTVATNDSDLEGGVLSFTSLISTKYGSIVLNADGSYVYTPNANFNGKDTLTYQVCDNGTPVLCDTAKLIITVTPVNNKPVAIDDATTIAEDTQANGTVATNDSDIEGDLLSFTVINNTTNGTVVFNADGSYVYTPNANYNGKDSLTYQVCDNGSPVLCDTAKLIITITPVNDKPVAVNDTTSTAINTAVSVNAKLNDSDIDLDQLTYTFLSPSNGTVVNLGNGNVEYTPTHNFIGRDSLMYTVCDNGSPSLCDTAYVFIDVIGNPNTAPIAVNDAFTIPENYTMNESVATNDTDPENNPLMFDWLTQPTHGTFSISSNGNFTYTPDLEYVGVDSFLYVVYDNGTPSLSDTAVCVINIINTPKPSIGVALSVDAPESVTTESYNITYNVTVKNYGDIDLKNIRVVENLASVFPEPALFSVSEVIAGEGLVANPNFNGTTNKELLVDSSSTLAVGETRTIKIKVLVTPNLPIVTYINSVVAFGDMVYGDSTVSDKSIAGINPDPNGDNIPNEESNTELSLTLFVPTGFSPDGDGVNDGFIIKGIENYPQNSLSIFNRWGNKVYEQAPYDNSWSGNTKNASGFVLSNGTLPNGTYFYVLDFGVQSVKPVTGYIVIKR